MRLSKTFISVAAILVLLLAGILSGCVPPVPEVIDVTGVDIVEDDQSIKVDETLQLTAVITPEDATNKAVTWESDNPDVAIVDENGLVTALSAGEANITVNTEDGDFIDSIKITVTSQPSGGGSSPAPKKYEVTFGVYEENNVAPAGISSRLIRTDDNGSGSEPNLPGVTIEVFSDANRTDKVTTVTTDENGMATIKLPNGPYYFIASKAGYICGPENSEGEFITLSTIPVATPTVSGSFIIENDNVSVSIIAFKAYIVTFIATENINPQTVNGISRVSGIPLNEVKN